MSKRKAARPTNRILQAGSVGPIPTNTQAIGYLFTADEPCTAGNFRLDTGLIGNQPGLAYALVYVPSGYAANTIVYPSVPPLNMYDPSKNVLLSGVVLNDENEDHKASRYMRKLATGDRIALLFYNFNATNPQSASFELSFTTLH